MRIQKRVIEVDLRPRPCGKVYKGMQKKEGDFFGKDLNDKLRFHAFDLYTLNTIYSAYTKHQNLLGGEQSEGWAEKSGMDVIVNHLNIVFPGEIDDVFDSSMRVWNSKGEVMRICDRLTIQKERITYTDLNKQPCTRLIEPQKACPIGNEGMATACPLGCAQESTLTFQVAELLHMGDHRHATLTTHSWEDETGIPAQLELIQQAYGSIAHSEFEWKGIGKKIPFILSRYEVSINRPNIDVKQKLNLEGRKIPVRTGGKSKSSTWALQIKVNPVWHLAWMAWQEHKKAQVFGLQTNPNLLIQSGILDAEIVETPSLPPASPLAIAPAEEDDSWKIKAYEHGIECGIDPNTLKEMVTNCRDRQDLRVKMAEAKKALVKPESVPVEPSEPLLSEEITESPEPYTF